jgi:methionyl-tRNA synthetase
MADQHHFYVTTPIYYPTARPHLGSLYSTLLADVAWRWHSLQGNKTFFLTGTDEHGQKIAAAAQAAGMSPQAFVDQTIPAYQSLWKAYGIEYNVFLRTTDVKHRKAVQQWIELLKKKGDIYKGFYEGWYCTHCETYVTEVDLTQPAPNCPSCNRPTHKVSEASYFFRLSAYQDRLLQFYESNPQFVIPNERINEVINFVKAGLKDLSISRTTISWGIPFPDDPEHVVYVWADALNNYITGIGWPEHKEQFNKWWPAGLQVLGKDILRFHAVYWPAFLMAAQQPMPHNLLVHGWIKMGGQKMSKSFGNVLDPQLLCDTYGAEPIRYYLVRSVAVTHDHEVSEADIEQRITADLANDLGNLLNRMLTLALKYEVTTLSPRSNWSAAAQALHNAQLVMVAEYRNAMSEYQFHRALNALWKFIGEVNAYFHAQEPWKKIKTDKEAFVEIIAATSQSLRAITLMLWPVMPQTAQTMLSTLGLSFTQGHNYLHDLSGDQWKDQFQLSLVPPLFTKHEQKVTEIKSTESSGKNMNELSQTPAIVFDDWAKVDLRVGTITSCQEVPKSEKLYQLKVDFGPLGVRQILSGVRKDFAPEELINKQGVVVFNLAPRMMLGLESQGMLLFAKDEAGKSKLVTVSAVNGSKVL